MKTYKFKAYALVEVEGTVDAEDCGKAYQNVCVNEDLENLDFKIIEVDSVNEVVEDEE